MKFSELEYQRPDLDLLKEDFFNQISLIEKAEEAEVALKATKHIQEIQNTLGTLSTLVSIRNSINTKDSFYEEETAFWDEHFPIIGEWDTAYYRAVLGSKWRSELENYLPETFFPMAENSLKVFSPEIIPLLQQENKLSFCWNRVPRSNLQFARYG